MRKAVCGLAVVALVLAGGALGREPLETQAEKTNMGKPVMQWQIVTKNPEALTKFYTSVFDWKVNADNPLGYRMIDTSAGRGINGGIWPAPPEADSFVQLFVEVDDVAAYVQKALAAGATVLIPPQKLPEGGEMAILHDPEGIPFGIFEKAP